MYCIRPACSWNVRHRPSLEVVVCGFVFDTLSHTAVVVSKAGVFISNSLRYLIRLLGDKFRQASAVFSIGWLDSSVGRAED